MMISIRCSGKTSAGLWASTPDPGKLINMDPSNPTSITTSARRAMSLSFRMTFSFQSASSVFVPFPAHPDHLVPVRPGIMGLALIGPLHLAAHPLGQRGVRGEHTQLGALVLDLHDPHQWTHRLRLGRYLAQQAKDIAPMLEETRPPQRQNAFGVAVMGLDAGRAGHCFGLFERTQLRIGRVIEAPALFLIDRMTGFAARVAGRRAADGIGIGLLADQPPRGGAETPFLFDRDLHDSLHGHDRPPLSLHPAWERKGSTNHRPGGRSEER